MALASQIAAADTKPKKPVGGALVDDAVLALCDYDADQERQITTRASRFARKHALNPGDAADLLDALGLLPAADEPTNVLDLPTKPKRRKPPTPRPPDLSWQQQADCRGEDLELFFGREGEGRTDREAREIEAHMVCEPCQVRAQCLNYAITTGQTNGFWGGLNPDERAAERRRRVRRRSAA